MTSSYFSAKKLDSDWLTLLINQSEASFLVGNSLKSYFHLKSKPTMPLVVNKYYLAKLYFVAKTESQYIGEIKPEE